MIRVAWVESGVIHRSSEKKIRSPAGIRTRERRAPIRQAIAWTLVAEFGLRITASHLDTSLWLAAHEDHKFRTLAGLRAQRLVGNDQGRSRGRHPFETIQCVLWNGDPVERGFRTACVGRYQLS